MKEIYSFAQLCRDYHKEEYLEYWDYELNTESPEEVKAHIKAHYWFKCPRGIHESRQIFLCGLSKALKKNKDYTICHKCNSIGQYIVDNYGGEYLKKIWSEKNELDPFDIPKRSIKRIWLICQNDSTHPDYDLQALNFVNSHKCPYCAGKRVCETNSLLYKNPGILSVWSDKNEKMPNEYTFGSNELVWLKCSEGIHEDFQRHCVSISSIGYSCRVCNRSLSMYNDLTGQRFGRLVATELVRETLGTGKIRYYCDCDCGTKHKSILASCLTSGSTLSCGCFYKEMHSGENHYNWKGGITPENHSIRCSLEYKQWLHDVYQKDGFKCVICGSHKKINGHHIYPFYLYKNLRMKLGNGITLCETHHHASVEGSFHNIYGTCNNTPEQLEEYINNERRKIGNNEHFNVYEYIRKFNNNEDFSKELEELNNG